MMQKNFLEGLIALGNCYALCDENDQAQGVYRNCIRLFPGCHLTNLYMGMEFMRINKLKTALIAYEETLNYTNNDPYVFNEMGIVFYKLKQYLRALDFYDRGLSICNERYSYIYYTLILNKAHCLRKMK